MKSHVFSLIIEAIGLVIILSACSIDRKISYREIIAMRTHNPVQIDGKLEESDWKKTPSYTLAHARKQFKYAAPDVKEFFQNGVIEPGTIRLLWDENYLYVGIEFRDQDILAEGTADQLYHYSMGDTAEIFIKPLNKTWYWEIYVTPSNRKTVFFFPSRGMLGIPSCFPKEPAIKRLKTGAVYFGTLNSPWDRDSKWTAEIAIPRKEIGTVGEQLAPNVPWKIFFGRYNYGRNLTQRELSSYPQQNNVDFHSHYDYGRLKMLEMAK